MLFIDLEPGFEETTDVVQDTASDSGGEGSALLDDGEVCNDNAQCLHGNCTNYVCCAPGRTCCADDEDCAVLDGHLACNTALYECYEDCTSGGTAQSDFMCVPEAHCELSGCEPDIATGACDEDSDCASGECPDAPNYCCEQPGLCCATNDDCPDMFDGCATDQTQTCVFSVWHFPDSGQEQCFNVSGDAVSCDTITDVNDLYGQDGHHVGTSRSYIDHEDGTVSDEVTGLVWASVSSDSLDWSAALTHCADLETAGGGWRVPYRYELQTLVDHGVGSGVMIDDGFFDEHVDSATYWTATPVADAESTRAWTVDFRNGTVEQANQVDTGPRVRCVR